MTTSITVSVNVFTQSKQEELTDPDLGSAIWWTLPSYTSPSTEAGVLHFDQMEFYLISFFVVIFYL